MTSNANTMNVGMEAAEATGDRGAVITGDRGSQQAGNESLPGGPGDSMPNTAIQAMRSALAEGIHDPDAQKILQNGLSITQGQEVNYEGAGTAFKVGEAAAVAGAMAGGAFAGPLAEDGAKSAHQGYPSKSELPVLEGVIPAVDAQDQVLPPKPDLTRDLGKDVPLKSVQKGDFKGATWDSEANTVE